jgi:hypothetical protein
MVLLRYCVTGGSKPRWRWGFSGNGPKPPAVTTVTSP